MARSTSEQVFRHVIGVVLCLAAMAILAVYWNPAVSGGVKIAGITGPSRDILDNIFAAEYLIIMIAAAAHIAMAFAAMIKEAGEFVSDKVKGRRGDSDEETTREGTKTKTPKTEKPKVPEPLPIPKQVRDVNFTQAGNDAIKATWKANDDTDQVVGYNVDFRYTDRTKGRRFKDLFKRGIKLGGWQRMANEVKALEHTVTGIDVTRMIEVRVQARNIYKRDGDWGYSLPKIPGPGPSGAAPPGPEVPPGTTPPPVTTPPEAPDEIKELYKAFVSAKEKMDPGLAQLQERLNAFLVSHNQHLVIGPESIRIPVIEPSRLAEINALRYGFKTAFHTYISRELTSYITIIDKILKHEGFTTLSVEEQEAVARAGVDDVSRIYGTLGTFMAKYKELRYPGEVE